jgi:hypothetical protein
MLLALNVPIHVLDRVLSEVLNSQTMIKPDAKVVEFLQDLDKLEPPYGYE